MNLNTSNPEQNNVRPYIGGQAVLEGVMMRSPSSFAVVVRRADGSLSIRERPMHKSASNFAKWPLVRGVASLVEALKLGSEALRFSAELMEQDLNQPTAATKMPKPISSLWTQLSILLKAFSIGFSQWVTRADTEPSGESQYEEKRSANPMLFMTVIMVLFMVALPQLLAYGSSSLFNLSLNVRSAQFQLLTGFFKLFVVVGYLLIIRNVKEIRRVFQYHGAEHKTISTYEAKEDLIVTNARSKTTLHPRCGTTFLVMTVLISIVLWTALGPFLPTISSSRWIEQLAFFAMKLPFLPVLAAITFEIQRFTARYCLTGPLRILLWPGFLIQKITTIEPEDDQLEIALASLRATLWREHVGVDTLRPNSDAETLTFANYDELLDAPGLRMPKAA